MSTLAPLDVSEMWSRLNDELIELVDLIPDDKLDWSPQPELWNFKGNLLHIVFGRHGLMGGIIQDGKEMPDVLSEGQTADGIRALLRTSWERMVPFLSDAEALDRVYGATILGETGRCTGHWLAFGQLEHDIHHRGGMYHYLDQLGVAHPEPDVVAWKLAQG